MLACLQFLRGLAKIFVNATAFSKKDVAESEEARTVTRKCVNDCFCLHGRCGTSKPAEVIIQVCVDEPWPVAFKHVVFEKSQ
ncbi:hypothetical protein Poly21_15150 [Allorhodopirellula heiligendammensis]|uniref:Uncharacterized protein n=1 Tax=Allorhodopirellula heiligendammensis TaxID=2714739 RepID=A0A5C6C484_9BACT|nr:hypothetical protein Poly21_15150 [Allorhodopirellula heiligendammensis]|tara:strand:+ start:610 stop:855 length:246 start_codon:yes stop_codon:yes gene_type:complete